MSSLRPMGHLPALPVEIVLLIADTAARMHLCARRAWVASLCLVCRAFDATVFSVLYRVVNLNAHTTSRISPDNRRLAFTTTIICAENLESDIDLHSASILASAFRNVELIAGQPALLRLLYAFGMRPHAVVITGSLFAWPRLVQVFTSEVLVHVTHLYLRVVGESKYNALVDHLLPEDLGLTHVTIEARPLLTTLEVALMEYERVTRTFLRVPSLTRLLWLTRGLSSKSESDSLKLRLAAMKDPRICVDDSLLKCMDPDALDILYHDVASRGLGIWNSGKGILIQDRCI